MANDPNPVDIEQREGRVHRFKNHAVRRNVAAEFGRFALEGEDGVPPWGRAGPQSFGSDEGTSADRWVRRYRPTSRS
ncbi:hypothetical protein D3227_35360 [Mesorhizobium waimense]|uniref:Uncharacterized protein n=1 Tax=Mesorhizobium waimense TaxID=1300307 RepID=A0A3A5JZI4_9HYPH|nr:hypothetical protein D3227_35360 [Mesorhizobium waimense]